MSHDTSPARFTPTGFVPTAEQHAIQLSRFRVTLVEANAGAAKTTTLALRVAEALARGLAPEKIVMLVFTPEAREVMRARLVEIGVARSTAARVRVDTMETFAAQTLATMEDAAVPAVADSKDLRDVALAALEDVAERYSHRSDDLDIRTHNMALSQLLDTQSRLKATMALALSTTPPAEWEDDSDTEDIDPTDTARELGVPLTDYLATLAYEELRLGTFDDTQFRGPGDAVYDLACRLAQDDGTTALPDYSLIAADELHDLNEASFRVLMAMLSEPSDDAAGPVRRMRDGVYFVGAGDRDQVIHAQRGAHAGFLGHRFESVLPGTRRMPLTFTFRHGPHLAFAMAAFKQKSVQSNLPVTTAIAVVPYPANQPDSCGDRVANALADWLEDGHSLDQCAILLRDRHQSIAIENALMRANMGYRTMGMQGYLQREEVLFLRGLMAIALQNLAVVVSLPVRRAIVEALAIFADVPLSADELEQAKQTVADEPGVLKFFFTGQIARTGSESARARIMAAVAYAEQVAPDTSAWAALTEMCRLLDVEAVARRLYVHPHDAAVVANSIAGFIAAARHAGMGLRQFSEWLGAADGFAGSKKTKHLVLVECAANAKGQAFDHVLLPFLETGEFPSATASLAEEENLFYVAATRTRTRLTLLTPDDAARRSDFVARMALDANRSHADRAVRQNLSAAPALPTRLDLVVPYADKDVVKGLGARWDRTRKVWYVNAGVDPKPFAPWFPRE